VPAPAPRRCWCFCRQDKAGSPYARDYFLILKSEFAAIDPTVPPPADAAYTECKNLIQETENLIAQDPAALTIQKVFEVEMTMIRVLPDRAVRAKVWSARSTYHKLVGDSLFQRYLDSNPPDPSRGPLDYVRADLMDLVKGTHWWYVNGVGMERGLRDLKCGLTRYVSGGLLFFMAVLLLTGLHFVALTDDHHVYLAVLGTAALVIYAGVLGAVISTARRMSALVRSPLSDSDPVTRMFGIEHGQTGLTLSVLCGGMFALVLYFLFVAGLGDQVLNQGLLPSFLDPAYWSSDCDDLAGRITGELYGMVPEDSSSLARLLIWSFIAGFGEKFVPDILDRLTAKGADRRSGPSAAPASPGGGAGKRSPAPAGDASRPLNLLRVRDRYLKHALRKPKAAKPPGGATTP
jgi:hypothetical protein